MLSKFNRCFATPGIYAKHALKHSGRCEVEMLVNKYLHDLHDFNLREGSFPALVCSGGRGGYG